MPRQKEETEGEKIDEAKPEATIEVVTMEQLVNLKLDRILDIVSKK
jgi:hypothetical protein